MNAFLSLGRWIFPITFLVFGAFHFMNAEGMASMVPSYMPAPVILVYLSGAGLVAGAISMYLGKLDKLATTLLAVFLLIVVLTMHLPGAMNGDQMATSMLLKDLGLMAACMLYAQHSAKDPSVIG